MTTYRTRAGQELRLAERVGSGGEGTVYAIHGQPKLVAKIYNAAMTPDRERKLRAMVQVGSADLAGVTAWPADLVLSGRNVVGFTMPRADRSEEAHVLYGPKSRRHKFPHAGFDFLIGASINLAKAFATVHRAGIVVGDVNDRLAMITQNAMVRLIDCDSFQVRAGPQTFYCDVGVENFTPPELQGKAYRGLARTEQHDCFGLAVLIFHLLFLGRHPFAGRPQDAQMIEIPEAIRQHRFAYSPERHRTRMEQPLNTPVLAFAGGGIGAMFERAFASDASSGRVPRPNAGEWIAALDDLYKQLVKCRENGAHSFNRSLQRCPWCEIESRTRIELFNFVDPGGAHVTVDVEAIWAAIQGAAFPTIQVPPTLASFSNTLQPSPLAVTARQGIEASRQLAVAQSAKEDAESNVLLLEAQLKAAAEEQAEAIRVVESFEADVERLPVLKRELDRAIRRTFVSNAGVAFSLGAIGAMQVVGLAQAQALVVIAAAVLLIIGSLYLRRKWSGATAVSALRSGYNALRGSIDRGKPAREADARTAQRRRTQVQAELDAARGKSYMAMVALNEANDRTSTIIATSRDALQKLQTMEEPAKQRLAAAQASFEALKSDSLQGWVAAHEIGEEAHGIVVQVRALEKKRDREHAEVRSHAQQLQLTAFLDGFFIHGVKFEKIPKSLIATLVSNGIETAADVTELAVRAVSGFGPVRANELLKWRRQLERGFVFDPNASNEPALIADVNRRITAERRQHERSMSKAQARYNANLMPFLARKATVETELENALRACAQVQVDVAIVRTAEQTGRPSAARRR